MSGRIDASKKLLAEQSVYTVAIDDTEVSNLTQLLWETYKL